MEVSTPRRVQSSGNKEDGEMGETYSEEAYYVFNHADDQGFTIVAGDDRLPDIVGYATSGSFDAENIPDGLSFFLELYRDKVLALSDNEDVVTSDFNAVHRASSTKPVVAKMLTTQWAQNAPYNNLCPLYDGTNHGYVGCVALALGQVLRYHANPAKMTTAIPKYITDSGSRYSGVSGTRTYNWSSMPNKLTTSSSDTQKTAVATLLYHCGLALETEYGQNSSAFLSTIPEAVLNYFGMESDDILYTDLCSGPSEWIPLIDASLEAGRPVCIGGCDSKTGAAHAFVCDGRNASGLYSINWGWGGSNDGYFDITVLNANSTYSFSRKIQFVTNLRIKGTPLVPPEKERAERMAQLIAEVQVLFDAELEKWQALNPQTPEEEKAELTLRYALQNLQFALSDAKRATTPSESDITALKQAVREWFGPGDVTANRHCSIADVVREVALLNGSRKTTTILEGVCADTNGDDALTAKDLQFILNQLLK